MIVVVTTYYKYKQYLWSFIVLLFGAFGILGFSPYNFWPASIISLTVLLKIILDSTWRRAAWYTFFWGVGFFGSGLKWIYISIDQFSNMYSCINILLIILLVLYLILFPILFSVLLSLMQSYATIWHTVSAAPVIWSIVEYIRGYVFTGFPWLQFGYTQIDGPLKGIAPIFGVEGITFILILISGLLAVSIKRAQLSSTIVSLAILLLSWPLTRIQWYHLQPQRAVHVSLIQGNIDQRIKWNSNYVEKILKTYIGHTLPLLGKTKIIIWPESAIPGNEIEHNIVLTLLDHKLRQSQTNLITGIIGIRYSKNYYHYYNSVIVLGESESYKYPNCNRYDKHHLVLCSERFPFQRFFKPLLNFFNIPVPFMQKGCYFQPPLSVSCIKMTTVICYEIIFGKQIRDNFKSDTDFLLTVANNAWFGNSIGPWQYFQMARMRALELGRPLLCSTNNGITAIVNADGSLQAQLPQFISGVLSDQVIPTTGWTPYAKFGSWFFLGIVIYIFLIFKKYY
ncbi:apolipoprotein N-acyltransferase [Blochmannia endosymbiont of Camponotus sp. C-003]|uniref:apolipoprotein N-acyltransferase n=1 Tax=unclassified Candidatus Blochmanniella TaxID=711328 RepID=UPI002025A8F9|nr:MULTISPECIES: apolipoprotein N-acyltransferase [unclassified Candidatus Blochmannia]URJ23496.1 apolipoprotein N-acyltransferase [Blochmannia endosymbiont of Camponotus sp. C-003]URJ28968.1 apolipoprotein N-acyltransferase [Blochmannia endosymbiont of Camponotus sp. C-046]